MYKIRKSLNKQLSKEFQEKVFLIFIFIMFFVISIITGIYHEPWADEAQSYLMSRDTSFIELFKIIKYEGTPALWDCILKIYIELGLNYKYIWTLSMSFAIIGVYLLLFKTDIPLVLKTLLPFTYYILYQFNIIARSYCLILPILILISIVYDKKIEKNYIFSLLIILLSSVCSHTFFMAGFLYFFYIIEFIKDFSKIEKNKKIGNIISIIFIFLFFLITLIYVFPTKDCYIRKAVITPFTIISNAFFSRKMYLNIVDILFSIILIIIFFRKYDWKKYNLLLLFGFAPVIMMVLCHSEIWHIGIVFLAFLFMFIVTDAFNKDKVLLITFCIICFIQIFWGISTCCLDYLFCESPNAEIISELRKNNCENKIVYGVDYNVVELNPYFEKNIFDNFNSEKAYWNWRKNNNYMSIDEMIENKADIYIMITQNDTKLMHTLEKDENYIKKQYGGDVFARGYTYIPNYITMFIKKE